MRSLFVFCVLLASSLAMASGPALVKYGPGGLQAGEQILFAKAVDGVAYDAAQDLLWFRSSAGALQVVDLRSPKLEVVTIAKKWPDGGFAVKGLSNAGFQTDYAGIYPILNLGKKPTIGSGDGAYAGIWEEQDKAARKANKKIKIVGQKWLKKQAKRIARTVAEPEMKELPKITLPEAMLAACDEGPDMCGTATALGTTAYQLVVAEYGCGDACHTGCVLYEPKSKKFASPVKSGTWGAAAEPGPCDDYEVAPDAASYVVGANMCTLGKKIECADAGDTTYLGWVELP